MENAGIDYGLGKTNIDNLTGIRYGVIHQNEVGEFWFEVSQPFYSNCCPKCGNEPASGNDIHDMKRCPTCHKLLSEQDFDFEEPDGFEINSDEYRAHSDDYGDIFILKSPYYTLCNYCSPCSPGAGYIKNQNDHGIKAYCFGPECFEDGEPLPYKIYEISTGKEVKK